VIRGRSNGLGHCHCKGCGKTFNALTGTAPYGRSGTRLREKELSAVARGGVADTTSFRWRHRFLAAVKAGAVKLEGVVEADETPR
jgi:transposase-like protein